MQKEHDNLLNQVSQYKITEKAFKVKRNEDSSTIVQQTQTIISQEEAFKLGLVKLQGEIKKIQNQISKSSVTYIEGKDVPYVPDGYADTTGWYAKYSKGDTSKAILDSFLANSILVPRRFSLQEKWFSVDGSVKKRSVHIEKIIIPNNDTVTVGWKNKGFLGIKKVPVIEWKVSNPYILTTEFNNVTILPKKGLLSNPYFLIGLGLVGGFYLHSKF